jgi:hypothetical protein
LRGFEEDLASKRDADGEVYDRFTIAFDKPQDPQFVKLNQFLGGFDILNAQYSNRYNELCKFKMLQIVTKEMDVFQHKEGIATSTMSNLTLGRQQPRAPTHLPFGSPPRMNVPPQNQPSPPMSAPMPAPVHSMPMPAPMPAHNCSMPMPAPTPAPVHSMPMPAHAQAHAQAQAQAKSQIELDILQAFQELNLEREQMAHQLQAEREASQKQCNAELNHLQNAASTREQQLAACHQQTDTKAVHVQADSQKIAEVKAHLEKKKAEVEAKDQEVQRRHCQVENAEGEHFALNEAKLPKRTRV